ncbi:Glycosyltransferase [Quillaja saponaria]|uniref:Glycosyltransferase n=1 Tax=Quillaja saponaria TaxID=32244 RepID=A0AAD7PP41_QUISA|nr:Glycosyltransferase [Quillaja saponaria]
MICHHSCMHLEPATQVSVIWLWVNFPTLIKLIGSSAIQFELEPEATDWMAKMWPVRTIGPAIPSMF